MLVSEMPNGGFKASGYGKDLSMYALEDYYCRAPRDGEAVNLLQLVAIRSNGRRAGHVIARAALHEVGLDRMLEGNECRPVI